MQKKRREIDRRLSQAKRAFEEASAALEKNKERAAELQAGLMKPGQDLGTLAYFQKQLTNTRAEEPLLKAAEDEAKRTYEDLQIAERLVKDAEKAHRTEEREFAGSEKRLVKMKLKVGDAKAKAAALEAAEDGVKSARATEAASEAALS